MTDIQIDEILHRGTPEEIMKVRCPDCGGVLSYCYTRFEDDGTGSFSTSCESCHILSRGHLGFKHLTPACVEYFGSEARIDENLKLKQTA